MLGEKQVLDAIYRAVDEVNQILPLGKQLQKTPEAALRGGSSTLDSLGLVNLLLAVERQVEERFGTVISLFDDRVFSSADVTLGDIRSLAEYISVLLAEKQGKPRE